MIHTPILDDNDPRSEYSNTPHSFTGKTPAEILMKLFQRTNLPSLPAKPYSEDKTAKERDKASLEKNKRHFDKRKKAKDKKLRMATRTLWPDARPQPRHHGTPILTRWWTSITGGPPSREGGAPCRETHRITEMQTTPLTAPERKETSKFKEGRRPGL